MSSPERQNMSTADIANKQSNTEGDQERDDSRRMESRHNEMRETYSSGSNATSERERNAAEDSEREPLLPESDSGSFQKRWVDIQSGFVDEPRQAVEKADTLVAEVMQSLAAGFASERSKLESKWGRGEQATTEDLRTALRMYRSFFQRLLAV
jgi:hypothetical protein